MPLKHKKLLSQCAHTRKYRPVTSRFQHLSNVICRDQPVGTFHQLPHTRLQTRFPAFHMQFLLDTESAFCCRRTLAKALHTLANPRGAGHPEYARDKCRRGTHSSWRQLEYPHNGGRVDDFKFCDRAQVYLLAARQCDTYADVVTKRT